MVGFKVPDRLPVPGGSMKVELDKRSLFALASDTRLEMLKALQTNRRTLSQLAELMKIDKAAVHRHLKKLEEGGLVARTEDHGFVYYALTWKSRDILSPNDKTKIIIMLSSSFVCLLAMMLVVFLAMSPSSTPTALAQKNSSPMVSNETSPSSSNGPSSLTAGIEPFLPAAILGLAGFALSYSAYLYWKKPRQKGGEESEISFGPERATDD